MKLQLSEDESEENELLKKSNQELDDKLKETTEELNATKKKLQDHDQAAKRAIAALQKEMALRVDQVSNSCNSIFIFITKKNLKLTIIIILKKMFAHPSALSFESHKHVGIFRREERCTEKNEAQPCAPRTSCAFLN